MRDHTIVCGYGTKGRERRPHPASGAGTKPSAIVVIDENAGRARLARRPTGSARSPASAAAQEVLEEAGIRDARTVIVAVDRDDSAVLVTLTARELNPTATIVASVREEENVHLLHQSGADGVITSSAAAGRLLGLSSETPQVTEVLEDLLTVGAGLDIHERELGTRGAAAEHTPELDTMLLGGRPRRRADPVNDARSTNFAPATG